MLQNWFNKENFSLLPTQSRFTQNCVVASAVLVECARGVNLEMASTEVEAAQLFLRRQDVAEREAVPSLLRQHADVQNAPTRVINNTGTATPTEMMSVSFRTCRLEM